VTGTWRAAAFALWFYTVTLVFTLAGVPVRIAARGKALDLAKTWVRTVMAGMAPVAGIRVVITGQENLPTGGPALLASQHQSEFDTLVWMTLLPRPSYVMKRELTRIPLFGPLLVPAGMIPVDRAAGAAALRQLLADTGHALRAGRQIVIFPEGTRVPPGQVVKLQPGIAAIAARRNMAVIPVATDSGHCWRRGVLGRRPGIIHVAIGPAIPAGTPRSDLMAQIEAFWRRMESTGFATVDNPVGEVSSPGSLATWERVNAFGNNDS
jgi:1-acyl-sn-glycerol-3-phosphate acyltransferase